MPLSITSQDVDSRLTLAGPARVYQAAYVSNGADASFAATAAFLGATEGGVEVHYARTMHPISCDQLLNDVEAFAAKEEVTVKAKFLQMNLANLNNLIKPADASWASFLSPAGGAGYNDTSGTMGVGEGRKTNYVQLLVKSLAPPGATGPTRIFQAWKAYVSAIGTWKHEKAKETGVEITWKCLTDVTCFTGGAWGKPPIFWLLDS